jgi:hypothetical protein
MKDRTERPMKADYIKLSSKGVEATGRYVLHALWSYMALRILGWGVLLILSLAAGASAWPVILRVASRILL